METFPLTIDEIRELTPKKRQEVISAYHKWLYEKREEAKRKLHNIVTRNTHIKVVTSEEYAKRKIKKIAFCIDCKRKICKNALRCLRCAGLKRKGVLYLPSRKQFKNSVKQGKQGSVTSPTAWLIFVIMLMLIAYILSLPPEYRRLLLS